MELLELSRDSLYYQPLPVSEADQRLMLWIDERRLEVPFLGSVIQGDLLVHDGFAVSGKHLATLMRKMDGQTIHRRANSRLRHLPHPMFPCRLRHLDTD